MELVTGFAGAAHIDPIDAAHLNVAGFGPDAYLLDTQNKLEASLETANKLVVGTGDLMIQGHHFTVIEPENIALQSGVSGQKRNALVCARYDKAEGTGVESASWIVKYGTATTGTPADPTVTSGDILDGNDSVHEEPIFRIEYDGITPGDPILLVLEFQSASKFRDYISPVEITLTPNSGTTPTLSNPVCFAIPAFRMCFIHCHASGLKGNMSALREWTVATIEQGYEPSIPIDLYGSADNNSNMLFSLRSDGQIVAKALDKATPAGTGFSFSGFWTY